MLVSKIKWNFGLLDGLKMFVTPLPEIREFPFLHTFQAGCGPHPVTTD